MNKTELSWTERSSELESVASVWTGTASLVTSRTVLADPCISIILVKSKISAEVIIRGPETKPRSEILLPGYTWTGIRLQPGVQLKNFPTQQFTDSFRTLPADSSGQFQFEGTMLQFPDFNNVEQLMDTGIQGLTLNSARKLNKSDSYKSSISPKRT